jgi:NDP-sugar pyrophosphorylase family protein
MRAMILAAGLGTRLRPITNSIPKALIKIKKHTLLELQIRKLKDAGFKQIIINIHHHAKMIEDYLKQNSNFNCEIELSDESDKLLDTGGGLKKASWFFKDSLPFLVQNVDIVTTLNLNRLLEHHKKSNALATLALMERNSSRYFVFDEENFLVGWKNEKTEESKVIRKPIGKIKLLAFSGIQVINPKLFKYFPKNDVFSLVDLYLAAASEKRVAAFIHSDDMWLDSGKKENLVEAENLFEKIRNTYQV